MRWRISVAFLAFAVSIAGQTRPVTVVIETSLGVIEAEIDTVHAPVTAANFLKYVDAGYYDGGQFHRTAKPDNQPNNLVKIEAVRRIFRLSRWSVLRSRASCTLTAPYQWRVTDPTARRRIFSSASGISRHWISRESEIPTGRDSRLSGGWCEVWMWCEKYRRLRLRDKP